MTRSAPPRILITRLSALGDCVQTLPVACALKDFWPECHISWVTHPANAVLLKGHPCIDRILTAPRGYLLKPQLLRGIRRELQSTGCEISIDPQSLIKSAALGWFSGARRRLGFAAPQGRELAPWLNNELVKPQSTHMVNRYLELLQPLGIENPDVRFGIPLSAEATEKIDHFLSQAHLRCKMLVLNPGAGWNSKLWPTERFARLAKQLGQVCNLPSVVIWSGAKELAAAESIVAGSGGHAVLAPNTSIPELAALLRLAQLVVSADTGPLHLAAAVGTRCVGLFGSTRQEECGPYGPGNISLQSWYQTGSSRERRVAVNRAMQAIDLETVFQACCQSLAASHEKKARVA